MIRRRVLAGATAGSVAAVGLLSSVRPVIAPTPSFIPPPRVLLDGPVRVTAIQTGWVAVKASHRAFAGPAALRRAALVLDRRWTEWLPITCWLVEHPDGPLLVDTGETARTAEAGYFGCDPGTRWVYEHLLRFDVPASAEVGAQLRALGIPPEEIGTVALTHLHSDHAGGLADVPNARVWLSRTEAERPPPGALPCRWPAAFRPATTDYPDGPVGAFPASHALTADGRIRLVPTPGHTRGHQSVLIGAGDGFVLLAGDASFSEAQVRERVVAGICEDAGAARRTLALLAEHLASFPTRYVAAHDAAQGAAAVTAATQAVSR